MRVLVTGASGFLGRYVVREVAQRGHEVRALMRTLAGTDASWFSGVEVVTGDLRQRDLQGIVTGIDAVIHLAAAVTGDEDTQFSNTVVGTENLLTALGQTGIKRFVLCSSFSVYDWSAASKLLDESTPLESHLYNRDGYAIAKGWQEKLVRRYAAEQGWQLAVFRPGLIWGPEKPWISDTGHTFGNWHVVIGGNRQLPITYVENCAECIAIGLEHPAAAGETFNIVDSEQITAWQYEGEALRATGALGRRLYFPYSLGLLIAIVASGFARLAFGPKAKLPGLLVPIRYRSRFRPVGFTSQKAQTMLGWRPRWTFAEAWKRGAAPPITAPGEIGNSQKSWTSHEQVSI